MSVEAWRDNPEQPHNITDTGQDYYYFWGFVNLIKIKGI